MGVEVAYTGFDIGNEFVIGYGLDYAERYRNLPFVGTLAPHVYGGEPADHARGGTRSVIGSVVCLERAGGHPAAPAPKRIPGAVYRQVSPYHSRE